MPPGAGVMTATSRHRDTAEGRHTLTPRTTQVEPCGAVPRMRCMQRSSERDGERDRKQGAPGVTVAALLSALRERVAIDDAAFDQLYPDAVRRLSIVHWTPV